LLAKEIELLEQDTLDEAAEETSQMEMIIHAPSAEKSKIVQECKHLKAS
jgi:hypothetical protein